MMDYVDVEGMRRAAHTADSAADSMRHSAGAIEQAAQAINQFAQQIGEAVTRIAHQFEPGYGGNGLRLVELLESGCVVPEVGDTKEVADVWVIAQQTVVDLGGPRKQLGYTLLPGADVYATSEAASDAIGIAKYPLGWVYLKLSQIIPVAVAPITQALPVAVDMNSTLEQAALICERRATRSDRAHGGVGQMFADTQDAEAFACAEAIRAAMNEPKS